jgi:hypothetical protein
VRLVGELERDVVFAMSRGSKELFHSNLLGWYLERFPRLSAALLDAWQVPYWPGDPDPARRVRREWRRLDLVVHEPGRRTLVVENKVFALPDAAQLDAYTRQSATHAGAEPVLVLLSLSDPGWVQFEGSELLSGFYFLTLCVGWASMLPVSGLSLAAAGVRVWEGLCGGIGVGAAGVP